MTADVISCMGTSANLKKRVGQIVLSPYFSTTNTLLISLAGGLFGIYADDIRDAWPFQFHARGPISWTAFWSWMTAILAALGFFFRQRADDTMREKTQAQLVSQTAELAKLVHKEDQMHQKRIKELSELIRTLPPAKFVDSFAELHEISDIAIGKVLASRPYDPEQVEEAIRLVLRAVATLARIFDGDLEHVSYAANIMIYTDSASLSAHEKNEIQNKSLKFVEPGVTIDGLAGILELQIHLSANTVMDESHDTNLKPLALPVPLNPRSGTTADAKWKVLPGAPLAIVTGLPDIHTDFALLMRWCAAHGEYSPSVMREFFNYLESHSEHMQGFLSVPLLQRENPTTRFAVLNVHCQRKGLLHDHKQAVAQFVSVVKPFQSMLVKLIIAYRSIPRNGTPIASRVN